MNFRSYIYSLLISLSFLYLSCKSNSSIHNNENLGKKSYHQFIHDNLGKDFEEQKDEKKNLEKTNTKKGRKVLIVMVYGLVFTKDSKLGNLALKTVENDLKKTCPNSNIKFLYIKLPKSVNLSLIKQGELIYNQIRDYVNANPNMKEARMIFIGHCTGGMASYETCKLIKNKYNVVGIISAGTPWEGADILVNRHKELTWVFNLTLGLPYLLFYREDKSSIQEIKPESCYLKSLKDSLNNSKIPIWAIGGRTDYYKQFFKTRLGKAFIRKNATEEKVFGSCDHDGVITLKSQIGINCPGILSVPLKENSNHTPGSKLVIVNSMNKIIKLLGFSFSKEDKKRMVSIKSEPSIIETKVYSCLVKKFVEKYGLFPNRKYPDDLQIIKECQL